MRPAPSAPPSSLRVLHVAGTANGAAWVHEQVRDLRARGHEVSVIIAGADGTLAPRLEADGIPYEVAELDIFAGGSPVAAARRVVSLARTFRRLRPDVVQYHLFPSIVLGRMAAWVADVPVRLSMIPGPYYLEAPGLRDVDVRTAPLDTKVIASCEFTRELYTRQGVPRDHIDLIYYGQDPVRLDPSLADGTRVRRELGIEPARPVVGDVAYFYAPSADGPFVPPALVNRGIKGHEVLLHAVPRVLQEVPDALFLLVGGGWGAEGDAYQRKLEALADELGVAHAVRFTGPRSDIPDTLAAFDVSVQCSLNENLGGSIESLLMARPLVASAVGGLVDAVIHERTGLLVPPGDAPALAQAIVRLLRDRAFADRVAAQGREHALALLTLESTIDNLDALYKREAAVRGRGYRLWLSALRLTRFAFTARELSRPLHEAVSAFQRRTAGQPGAEPAASFWQRVRGRDLHLWNVRADTPASGNAASVQTPRSPRVVQVAGNVEDAGWLLALCRSLQDSGIDVAVVLADSPPSVAATLREAGVPCQAIAFGTRRSGKIGSRVDYALRFPWTAIRLAALFRREGVNVVHGHASAIAVSARVGAWLAAVPLRVSRVQGNQPEQLRATRWERRTRWMDHRTVTDLSSNPMALYAPQLTAPGKTESNR